MPDITFHRFLVRQPVTYSIEKMLFLSPPFPAFRETFAAAKGEGKGVGFSGRNHISRRSMRD